MYFAISQVSEPIASAISFFSSRHMLRAFIASTVLALGFSTSAAAESIFKRYHGYISGNDAGACFGTVFSRYFSAPSEACGAWIEKTEQLLVENNYCSQPPFKLRTPLFSGMKGNQCVIELQSKACAGQGVNNDCPGGWVEQVVTLNGGPYETTVECSDGYEYDYVYDKCFPVTDRVKDVPQHCPAVGRPIHPLTGSKSFQAPLGGLPGVYEFMAKYDTRNQLPGEAPFFFPSQPAFGTAWYSNALHRLAITRNNSNQVPISTVAERDGARISFETSFPGGSTDQTKSFVLMPPTYGEWGIKDLASGRLELYTYYGVLRTSAAINGPRITFEFSTSSTPLNVAPKPDLPIKAVDSFGRTLLLSYKTVGPANEIRMSGITVPEGGQVAFEYNANAQLSKIVWPDGSAKEFRYDTPTLPWALTSVIDESGRVLNRYGYDGMGRAISTEMANGVNRYAVTWEEPPKWVVSKTLDLNQQRIFRDFSWQIPQGILVTTPNGEAREYGATGQDGFPRLSRQSQSAGSGCLASVKQQEHDTNGNVSWQEDFRGYRTCYANDLSRNLQVGRVEGLASNSSCDSVLTAGATLPGNARRVSTEWHPTWRVETRVAEPRRLTTKIYNGQFDPFAGRTASCADGGTLPDYSPIIVLCKQVEQATLDSNGSQGFAAALASTSDVPIRIQQWTYNEHGQMLTAKDALNNTTTYSYHTSTGADYTVGDLANVTNALNQTTRFTKYNKSGQWLEMVDANGVTTTRTFDLRQRLKSTTTAGLTTSYDYWPTGLLKTVTLPDASSVNYGYDDAYRLTSVTDNLGNKVTYTLDNSGNRIGEEVKDPTGRLAKTLTRVPDALNRIQQVSGRE